MIFELLRDNFCASGREVTLIGKHLRDHTIIKMEAKHAKLKEAIEDLRKQSPADYFIGKVAQVDPVEGEILITEGRIQELCAQFDVDELCMLYERLRSIKVERLREGYGTDIVSIVSANGQEQQSHCEGRDKEPTRRPRGARREIKEHREEMESASSEGGGQTGTGDMSEFMFT